MSKNYWKMTLSELVDEWGDNTLTDEMCNGEEREISKEQREYYLWRALAKDIEQIKKLISPPEVIDR